VETVTAQVDQVVGLPRLTQDMVDKGDVWWRDVVDRGAAGLDLPAGEDLTVVEGDADGDIPVAGAVPPAVDDRGDVPVADVVGVPVGAVRLVEAEERVCVLHRVGPADRRGTRG
jgi:hypothetical protein